MMTRHAKTRSDSLQGATRRGQRSYDAEPKQAAEILHRSGAGSGTLGAGMQDKSASAPKWHSHIAYQSSREQTRPARLSTAGLPSLVIGGGGRGG